MCMCATSLQSCPTLCDPVDCSPLVPLSMGFSKQEYWNGLPCPPPGDLPNPGIEPAFLMSPALADGLFTMSATWEAQDKDVGNKKFLFGKEKRIGRAFLVVQW